MRYLVRYLGIGGLLALVLASFTNFSPLQILNDDSDSELAHLGEDIQKGKEYVKIGGQYYEKNKRGIYYIDGVPTLLKTGKRADAAIVQENPNLGKPIDPKIYKDAMGLDEEDVFFKPKTEVE